MKVSSWIVVGAGVLAIVSACTTRRVKRDDDEGFGGGPSVQLTVGSGGTQDSASAAESVTSSSAASTVAASTSAASTVASSSTGPQGCDTNVPGDMGTPVCDTCIQCTANGPCATQFSACAPSTPCDQYWDCLINCDTQCNGDPTCMNNCVGTSPDPNNQCSPQTPQGTCIGDYPSGCNDYIQALTCAVCVQCQTNCNAAAHCI